MHSASVPHQPIESDVEDIAYFVNTHLVADSHASQRISSRSSPLLFWSLGALFGYDTPCQLWCTALALVDLGTSFMATLLSGGGGLAGSSFCLYRCQKLEVSGWHARTRSPGQDADVSLWQQGHPVRP